MNGNSVGFDKVKRMELEFKGTSYQFTINPEMYDITIPNRQNVVYTKAGAFIDLFGEGINEITITGTTGWKAQTGDANHGHEQFLNLKSLFQANMNNIQDGKEVTPDDLLRFINHTDGEGYYTVPTRLRIYRNVNQPLLYKYDISLTVIKSLNEAQSTTEVQAIGSNVIPETASETIRDRVIAEDGNNAFSPKNEELGRSTTHTSSSGRVHSGGGGKIGGSTTHISSDGKIHGGGGGTFGNSTYAKDGSTGGSTGGGIR